jgi:elongation factor P
MLSYSDLKTGVKIIINGDPYEIIESAPMFKGRGQSVLQTRVRNLKTGNVLSWTFRPSDTFQEASVAKKEVKFIYSHRDKYVFSEKDDPSRRFELTEEQLGSKKEFLKEDENVEAIVFEGEIINISLPLKINLEVTETPPAVRTGRAEAGTKPATLETGAKVNVPIFIEAGDIIEVNTETGEYVRRIED